MHFYSNSANLCIRSAITVMEQKQALRLGPYYCQGYHFLHRTLPESITTLLYDLSAIFNRSMHLLATIKVQILDVQSLFTTVVYPAKFTGRGPFYRVILQLLLGMVVSQIVVLNNQSNFKLHSYLFVMYNPRTTICSLTAIFTHPRGRDSRRRTRVYSVATLDNSLTSTQTIKDHTFTLYCCLDRI